MVEFEDNLTDLVRTQMHSFKSVLISTLATALVLVTFPAAAVVGSGSTPVDLSAIGGGAYEPQVTVSSTSLATAVWTRWNGSHDVIQSSTSQNGGAWSTPVDLSATGGDAFDPQVTVSSTGLVTAVWTRDNGSHDIIQSSTSQSGGAWSTPVNLSASGEDSDVPQVTVSSTGLVTAVWYRDNGSNYIIQSSTSQNGGAWSTPVNLSAAGRDAYDPQVTVDSTGLATAVWHRYDGSHDVIQSSTSQNGGAWSTPVNLSAAGRDAYSPQVTVSSTGLATAVWYSSDGSQDIIQSSTSQNGGAWSTPEDLSATGGSAYSPQVTVSSTGLATAVWYRYDGSNNIIQSSTSQNGGAWSTPEDLSATGGDAGDPQVTVSSTGLVSAVWFRWNGSHNIIQSSTSQNGGAWSTPVDLSATGASAYEPQVTVSSTGLVTAVWYRYDGSHNIIQSSTLSNSTPPTTPAATTTPKLATTGANVEWLMVAGLIAAIAGAGFLTVSRRKRSA
jgi:LPXTG-motif cell wall-anchored protein